MSTLDPDPVTPWTTVAAEILTERQRRAETQRWSKTIRISDPATSPQILANYGLTRETAKARTRLLARARKGDPEARRMLQRRYACVVFQRPEVEAWTR